MHLARILRFFGLRSRHAGGRRARLSIRMSRVFHRHSSRRSTVDSGAAPTPSARRAPTTCDAAPSRMEIPENEPVALNWGMSSSTSMDLRKSPLVRQDDLSRRLLVQRLILEELENQARRGTSTRDSRMSMIEQAQALMETRGADVLALPPASRNGHAQPLTRKEEKKLRKSVTRAVRAEAKQQKKLEKLNRQRAKQYARAQAFFEQRATDASGYLYGSSYNRSGQSDSYHFGGVDAAEAKWQRHRADSAASSLSRRGSSSSVRSSSKPPRMEFLFFGGSPDDTGSLNELEVGRRRYFQRRSSTSRDSTARVSWSKANDAELAQINPTLVRNMPRPFAPRMTRREVFI